MAWLMKWHLLQFGKILFSLFYYGMCVNLFGGEGASDVYAWQSNKSSFAVDAVLNLTQREK